MAIEAGTFETLIPSRYISFTLPLDSLACPPDYFSTNHLQIYVLDSPTYNTNNKNNNDVPKVAAMLVPNHLEDDWIFTTKAGHLQLLLACHGISRLILIGNAPSCDIFTEKRNKRLVEKNPSYWESLERSLYPLLMALLPKEIAYVGNFEVPFLSYEDNVICSVALEKCIGPCVGEMLVEDVEIEGHEREFRRRLRFKRMPNLVQTEVRILPTGSDCLCIGESEFCPDLGLLVHPYLAPMVAGLSLAGGYLQECFDARIRARCLCIGVGGGALLSFLCKQLGFEVVGVEVDDVVLRVAREYFGLEPGEGIELYVGDGIEFLKKRALHDQEDDGHTNIFDVIMVDLDSSDSKMGISAPAIEFVQKDVLLAAKSCLSERGILVLNVIPPNRLFCDMLKHELLEAFVDLHEIDCGNEENFVLIAAKKSIDNNSGCPENAFVRKLKSTIQGALVDSIRKI